MKKLIRHAALAALLTSGAVAGMIMVETSAYAAAAPRGPAMSRRAGPLIQESQKAYQAMDFATALAKAAQADMQDGKNPFDEYLIAQVRGLSHIAQMDLAAAAPEFDKMLASPMAPAESKPQAIATAFKLHYSAKNYTRSIALGTELAVIRPLDDTELQIMTDAYLKSDDAAGAAKFVEGVIAAKQAAGQRAPKVVLQQLIAARIALKDEAGIATALEQLTLADPTPENWKRLTDRGFAIQGVTEPQLLNLYRLRVLTNAMDANDYLGMAGVSLKQGLPEEAKKMLQKGIDAGTLTAAQAQNLMTQAQQMGTRDSAALAELEKAGAAAKEGETDVKLAESLYAYGRLADAETVMKRGLGKGSVKDVPNSNVVLGVILLAQGKKDEARAAFTAAESSPQVGQIAHLWLVYTQG